MNMTPGVDRRPVGGIDMPPPMPLSLPEQESESFDKLADTAREDLDKETQEMIQERYVKLLDEDNVDKIFALISGGDGIYPIIGKGGIPQEKIDAAFKRFEGDIDKTKKLKNLVELAQLMQEKSNNSI
jgi:hypothetical protein